MKKFLQSAVGLLFLAGTAGAQITSIPAATGGGGGAATSIRSGLLAAIPATCTVADVYWATDASLTGGAWKEYSCTATNTWTQKKVSNVDGTLTFTSSANGDVVGSVTSGVFDTLAGNATFGAAADKDYASAYMRPPTVAFASLPSAATVSGRVFVVTDCATAACTAGSGSIRAWLRSTGSAYELLGGSVAAVTWNMGAAQTGGGTRFDIEGGVVGFTSANYAYVPLYQSTGAVQTVDATTFFMSGTEGTVDITLSASLGCLTAGQNFTDGSYGSASTAVLPASAYRKQRRVAITGIAAASSCTAPNIPVIRLTQNTANNAYFSFLVATKVN